MSSPAARTWCSSPKPTCSYECEVMSEKTGIPDARYGTVIGRDFMVQRLLRKGAMGAVFIAEQLSTPQNRAGKLLRREYVADDTLFKRFEREAQMAARIPSEHVTQIIASGV